MKKRYLPSILTIVIIILFAACPMGGPDPDPDPDPATEDPFIWSNPKAPDGVSVFDVSALVDSSRARVLTIAAWVEGVDDADKTITPDNVKVAYRYIAMVPEDIIEDMAIAGFYGHKGSEVESPWNSDDITEYLNDFSLSKIPGCNSSHNVTIPFKEENIDGRDISFVGYVDSSTPVTSNDIKTYSDNFVIFDGTNGTDSISDDTLKVFDLAGDALSIEVEEVPSAGVVYCGVAYELVYYEAEIDEYGLIRHYYNDFEEDFGLVEAGDMVVNLEISHPDYNASHEWQWVYLKHGDGPDSLTGTISTPTVVDKDNESLVGYDQVWAPEDQENPSSGGDWKWWDYGGVYPYNYKGSSYEVPVFMLGDEEGWGSEGSNSDKQPSGTAPFLYWMLTNYMMNGDFASDPNLSPTISGEDNNPGGFGNYDPDDDGNPIDSTPIYLGDDDVDSAVISGEPPAPYPEVPHEAYMVYCETDDHLSEDDVSGLLYSSSRKDDDEIISRQEMADNFGVYAYDSGLITQVYDDSPMVRYIRDGENYALYPTLLDISMGRLCVIGNRYEVPEGHTMGYVYNPPDPSSPDALYESIVKVDIKLEIKVNMRFGVDCLGRFWDGGTAVAESDFPERFMEFIPNYTDSSAEQNYWGADPNGPVPAQRGFDGVGMDDPRLSTELSFVMDRFAIQVDNVRYEDIYSMPPEIRPNPEEGPFSTADFPQVKVNDINVFPVTDTIDFYYTISTDPDEELSDPDEDSASFPYPDGYDIGTTDTHIKVIAVEEGKEPSKVVDVWYIFEKAGGSALTVTISNNPTPDGTEVFIGLFRENSLNIDQEINPVYSEVGTLSGGGAACTFANVDNGTYYLLAIADVDDNKKVSTDDLLFPDQDPGRSSTDMFVSLNSSVVVLPGTTVYIDTADWWEVP
jgi:uncharacterized protein (DUF2141 family)